MQSKLKALLFERKIPQFKIAMKLGINSKTMSKKMNGKADFTYSEVFLICKMLSIENPFDVFKPLENRKSEMR